MAELDKYGRPYPPKAGDRYKPSVTTDAVVVRKKAGGHDILMITRKNEPCKGCHAFPGGFVDYNEDPKEGCLRELEEECNLKGLTCELLTVRGHPARDPRGHVITIAYYVTVAPDAVPKAGDDAATAHFYDLDEILAKKDKLAFDHYDILQALLPKLSK